MNTLRRTLLWAGAATAALLLTACRSASTPTPAVVVVTTTPDSRAAAAVPAQSPPVWDEENLYIDLYERTSASVVHITNRARVYDFFRGAVPQEGTGSGFIIDTDGHILTNQHVIAGAEEIEVIFADDTVAKAELIGADAYNDLAVLRVRDVKPELLKPLPLGRSNALKVGTRVIAIGNPFGLDRTLTTGVISALGRTIERDGEAAIGEVIQTDAAINPGNSGGPLLNLRGEVIGVNTSIQSPSGGSVGIGFAVPADTVARVVPELISKGRYDHPTLGFAAYEISQDMADALKLPVNRGLLIARLVEDGPAARAGVRGATQRLRTYGGDLFIGGDILTAIDGVPTPTRDAMTIYLENNRRVGDEVTLSLLRDGEALTLKAVLGAR